MKTNLKKALVITIVIGSIITLASFVYQNKPKIVYVNTYSLYNEFKLKKELEEKLKKTQLSRKVLLDSIKAKIQMLSLKRFDKDEKDIEQKIVSLRDGYFTKEKQFNQESESQAQTYTDQVWEQLNQYIKDYGKENGYDYILGATGQGNLMYAVENKDVSKELIEYANIRYEGGK